MARDDHNRPPDECKECGEFDEDSYAEHVRQNHE